MRQATVLMALMGLDIGGVETHVTVLCKHLTEMGYKVVVASAGGVYEQELAGLGVRHYRVNMWTKRPLGVARAVRQLKEIVRNEEVSLMHAHARIPAFVCNIVSKLTGIPYLTTAHTDFVNNPVLQLFSCWGQKTISVSEDIEQHMIREFKIPSSRQVVILNGIDTGRFQPGLDSSGLQKELGLKAENRQIIYVSRLDNDMAEVACKVLAAFEQVAALYADTELIIAGAGNREQEVKIQADAINRRLGEEKIRMLGRRTDIPLLLNTAEVFIGVSRAALEAMACARPVILAGTWSYPGLLTPEKAGDLMKDNFTGRGFGRKLTVAELAADLQAEMARDEASRKEMGSFNRALVIEHYSSQAMAEKTAQVYEEILKRSVKSWASSMKKGAYSGKSMSLIYWLLCWSWLQSAEASINTFL